MTDDHYDPRHVETAAARFMARLGYSQRDAQIIAKHVVRAEQVGHPSHGLAALSYLGEDRGGQDRALRLSSNRSAISNFIAEGLTGYVAAELTLDLLLDRANKVGWSGATITGCRPTVGCLGNYAEAATAAGCLFGMAAVSAPGLGMKGTNVFGTNPICIGLPHPDGPLIVDLALSHESWGSVAFKANHGQALDSGIAVDSEGLPTQDSREALEGTLLPIGGAKGLLLAACIEILIAVLAQTESRSQTEWGAIMFVQQLDNPLPGGAIDPIGLLDRELGRVPGRTRVRVDINEPITVTPSVRRLLSI